LQKGDTPKKQSSLTGCHYNRALKYSASSVTRHSLTAPIAGLGGHLADIPADVKIKNDGERQEKVGSAIQNYLGVSPTTP
jgi:hypothetical protein